MTDVNHSHYFRVNKNVEGEKNRSTLENVLHLGQIHEYRLQWIIPHNKLWKNYLTNFYRKYDWNSDFTVGADRYSMTFIATECHTLTNISPGLIHTVFFTAETCNFSHYYTIKKCPSTVYNWILFTWSVFSHKLEVNLEILTSLFRTRKKKSSKSSHFVSMKTKKVKSTFFFAFWLFSCTSFWLCRY